MLKIHKIQKHAELENVMTLQRNSYPMASRAELDIPPTPSDPGGEPAVIPYSPLRAGIACDNAPAVGGACHDVHPRSSERVEQTLRAIHNAPQKEIR